ncbi:flagellar filament capping protein FliD [Calderihabitans maritimus]|uniref:Flagellar hook-associated protein 2 n=1 Tax=Calderihabitans maritimus TaxID=1246530 RepID=A0A1Z5HUE8_9FIRM|nr:flagellar filament capping protein FliD [Calderihabitans maritimus]GAW92910.1 flagellar capping protein [Calderihabitans maritimus]
MSTLTISGLASGLDTENIIKQLMEIERIPVQRLETRKLELEAERDAWRDLNTRLNSLSSKLTDLKLESTFTSKTATSSNEAVFTATATTGATTGKYEIVVQQLAQAHMVTSTASIDFSSPVSGEFQINGVTVTVSGATSLADIRDAINQTEGVGAEASIIDNRLVLSAASTGAGSTLSFAYVSGSDILKDLGIYDSATSTALYEELRAPQDALLTINGLSVQRSTNEISDAIEGVTLYLKNDSGIQETLTVTNDTQKAIDSIKAFVEQYNSVMDFISTKLEEGELQGDPTLMRVQDALKRMASDRYDLNNTYRSFGDIGITTTDESQELSFDPAGKLHIDETKLQEALDKDPLAVYNFFKDGIVPELETYIDSLITTGTGVLSAKEQGLEQTLRDIDEQIARLEERLKLREANLKRQFLEMEKAIATLQNQGNWLAGQIAGLPGFGAPDNKS